MTGRPKTKSEFTHAFDMITQAFAYNYPWTQSLWAVFIFHEERQKIFYKPWGLPDIVSRHSWTGSPLTDQQQKFPEEPRGTAAVCECVDESFVISDKDTISSLEHHKDTCSENMTCLFKKIYKLRLY